MPPATGALPAAQPGAVPTLGICGATEAEREALLAGILPALQERGLMVEVRRDDCWADRGKILPSASDLILVPGANALAEVIWLEDGRTPASKTASVLRSFGPERCSEAVLAFLLDWLAGIWRRTPVWGCVLIGGKSSRMGQPKHLLKDDRGMTWLERTVRLLRPLVADVVVSGKGELPSGINNLIRLTDAPGVVGPLSGILAAMRWRPLVSWLLVACDMPDITEDAVRWLLGRRRPGIWGTVPRLDAGGPVEPLLAHYDCRCAPLFEKLRREHCLRIGRVAADPKIETPLVPEPLRGAWRNVNRPEEL